MAREIDKLLLTKGGGVISPAKQMPQAPNRAVIMIGLGGTGIDAISAIKSQVYDRVLPDNVDALNDINNYVARPRYDHIKFLAIDSDVIELERSCFEHEELLSLRINNFPMMKPELNPEYAWVSEFTNRNAIHAPGLGAGGIRQLGRLQVFLNYYEIRNQIQHLIHDARQGLEINAETEIHLFTGFSGGTGSGSFLEICYMIHDIIAGDPKVSLWGYTFLPEVILSKTWFNPPAIEYIQLNGYAALQDLNYCMNIPNNGGSFEQLVPGGRVVSWDKPPVDLCHLVGVKDEKGRLPANPYESTMNSVAEHVINCIVFANVPAIAVKPMTGKYMSIGTSSAYVPYKDFSTYLVCKFFDMYKEHEEVAQHCEVDKFVLDAWDTKSRGYYATESVYSSLLYKLTGSSSGDIGYIFYYDSDQPTPWRSEHAIENLEMHYKDQFAMHIGTTEKKASTLTDNSDTSLVGLLWKRLQPVIGDVAKGPKYVLSVLQGSNGSSVLSRLAEMRAVNLQLLKERVAGLDDAYSRLEKAKLEFKNANFLSRRRLYCELEDGFFRYYSLLEKVINGPIPDNQDRTSFVGVYAHVNEVLDEVERRICQLIQDTLIPLNDVLDDLTLTFEDNKTLLESYGRCRYDDYQLKIATLQDENIRQELDCKFTQFILDNPNQFGHFMTALISAVPQIRYHGTRLARFVQSYFFSSDSGVFTNLLTYSLDDIVAIKYGMDVNSPALHCEIAYQWIRELIDRAEPLLCVDHRLDSGHNQGSIVYHSINASVVGNAMNVIGTISSGIIINPSLSADCIVVVNNHLDLNIGEYCDIPRLEAHKHSIQTNIRGCYYYEDGPSEYLPEFRDWRKLPTISLPSVEHIIQEPIAHDNLIELAEPVKRLVDEAMACGVISANSVYMQIVANQYFNMLKDLVWDINSYIDTTNSSSDGREKITELEKRLDDATNIQMVDSSINLFYNGVPANPSRRSEYLLDYVYQSPIYQKRIREQIDKVSECKRILEALKTQLAALKRVFS